MLNREENYGDQNASYFRSLRQRLVEASCLGLRAKKAYYSHRADTHDFYKEEKIMRIVLIGAGGHASDILGAFEARALHFGEKTTPIIGILNDGEVQGNHFSRRNVQHIGGISDLPHVDATHYIVAVGYSRGRKNLFEKLLVSGLEAASIVHPLADVPRTVRVGKGTVILSGVRISPMAVIGNHVYLSHGCLIGHDCLISDFATVLPGAAISGNTTLDESSLVGSNAVVAQNINIGTRAIVGAGAVVLKDVLKDSTVVGNPSALVSKKRR